MGARVLVVDDDPDIQATLDDVLTHGGFHVDVVANGAEAINFLDEHDRPAVLLVDLMMPGLIGNELLEYLASDEELSDIPIAIVSGSPELAPDGYPVFRKPIDIQPLLAFVANATSPNGG